MENPKCFFKYVGEISLQFQWPCAVLCWFV